MHRTTPRFRSCLDQLPPQVQALARRNFLLLRDDLRHPSLHFKKAGGFWSVRVGLDYRALAIEDGEDFVWVWIGNHDEYERLLRQQG